MTPLPLPLSNPESLTKAEAKRLQAWMSELRAAPYDRDDMGQFIAFAMSMVKRSKAQLFQDLFALWVNDQRRGGYFVEAGAADGVYLSNTWLLEKEMGWRGILAEPNPRFAKSLARNRSCRIIDKCLYDRTGETLDFLNTEVGELSRLAAIDPADSHAERRVAAETLTVHSISLNDLLAEAGAPDCIDFLSLDTEGSELMILTALDFSRWRFNAIAVEHNGTPAQAEIHALLAAKGYRRLWGELSRWDDWYVPAG